MALGNSSGKSGSRHKGQIRKAIRERRIAKDYNSFIGSALDATPLGACRLRDVNITYYHNGRTSIPRAGDIVYREKRARGNNSFGPGFIQFQDGGRGFVIRIDAVGAVVGAIAPC